jgi:hypothetical protein
MGKWKEWIEVIVVGQLWAFLCAYTSSRLRSFSFLPEGQRLVHRKLFGEYLIWAPFGFLFGLWMTFGERISHRALAIISFPILAGLVAWGLVRRPAVVSSALRRARLWDALCAVCLVFVLWMGAVFESDVFRGVPLLIAAAVAGVGMLSGFMLWRARAAAKRAEAAELNVRLNNSFRPIPR